MVNDSTVDYYNRNAKIYFQSTAQVDMAESRKRFLRLVKRTGTIIDIGAGSGRDMKFFRDKGYKVEGIDASEELCALAREYTGCRVDCVKIQDWIPDKKYDGVWANASLVHLIDYEIETFICQLEDLLEDEGIAYLSFKQGIMTGYDENGRFFSDYPQEKVEQILKKSIAIQLIDLWKSEDKMNRKDFSWVNILLKKSHQ